MKGKIFRKYYTELVAICILSVFTIVSVIAGLVVASLNTNRICATLKDYEKAVEEIALEFKDIWRSYPMAFIPVYKDYNYENFRNFCMGEGAGYERAVRVQNFEHILLEMCNGDDRLKGIYFKRFSDNQGYIFFSSEKKLKKISFPMEELIDQSESNVLGAIRIKTDLTAKQESTETNKTVFGIQSRVISVEETQGQFILLYDLGTLDKILERTVPENEARFWVTSDQGMVLYDSWGNYEHNKVMYCEYIDYVLDDENIFSNNGITYLKKKGGIKNGKYITFYMVPENAVKGFRYNGLTGTVILVGIIINVVVIVIMLEMNRLFGRKFQELESGMQQIGKNNIGYRMPVGKHEDEFTEIASHFNQMCDDLEDIINKNYVYQMLQRTAEYKALQTSVNPHFLYNSLEAVREKLDKNGHGDEAEMILLLSRIFEYQIRGDNIVTVRKELESLQNYIDFYLIRFQYKFEYSIQFEEEILKCKMPKHIFQPIMENYFVHGFRNDGKDHIWVTGCADSEDGRIHITFRDNGKGISEEQIEKLKESFEKGEKDSGHMGLCNVNTRLRIAFEKDDCVEIISNKPEKGVSISLILDRKLRI